MKKLSRNKCLICNKETKRHTTKTCSIECRNIFQIKNPIKPCLICNNNFKPNTKNSKYCSEICQYKSLKGRIISEKQRKQHSERMKGKLIGKLNPMYGKKAAHGKGYWHNTWENEKVFLRSSWELAFAKYLDSKNIRYQVENKRFPIKYFYQGMEKYGTYCPDFYLPDKDKYYEIKGWWRDDAKFKYDAFILQYPNIKNILITSAFLKKLNIKDVRLK